MNRSNKKGFTIVELVIVIAVIAILAAVLIPTIAGLVKKANVSKDTQLVKNLNTAIAVYVNDALEGDEATMPDALAAAKEFGYDIEKINAKADGNEILFDSVNKVFCYLNEGTVEYVPEYPNKTAIAENEKYKYWVIDDDGNTETSAVYSSYVTNVAAGTTVVANNSIDVTACPGVNVEYNKAGNVDIYTNGGKLTVSNESAEVAHYGESDEVIIGAVASASYHEFGKVGFTQVNKGHYVMEKGGSTNALVVANGVTVDNKGGNIVAQYNADEINVEDVKLGATMFAGGLGTEEKPYLIENAEQFQNISGNYDKAYAYYKVADGVESIDCSDWNRVDLNGSFDGNGVVLNSLDDTLFNNVNGETANIKNIEVNANIISERQFSAAVVYKVISASIIFENVDVHGIVQSPQCASYVAFGPGSTVTVNYTFKNCHSDCTLIATSERTAGFIDHAYCKTGSTLTLINSYYDGKQSNVTGEYRYYSYQNFNNLTVSDDNANIAELASNNNYTKAECTTKLAKGELDLPEVGGTFSVSKATGATYAIATLRIGPNDKDEAGSYTATYMTEECILVDGIFITDGVINFNITINGTATTTTGANGNTFNIISNKYGTTYNCAVVSIVQYDANNNVVSINEVSIKR